jgi:hypothetical protein
VASSLRFSNTILATIGRNSTWPSIRLIKLAESYPWSTTPRTRHRYEWRSKLAAGSKNLFINRRAFDWYPHGGECASNCRMKHRFLPPTTMVHARTVCSMGILTHGTFWAFSDLCQFPTRDLSFMATPLFLFALPSSDNSKGTDEQITRGTVEMYGYSTLMTCTHVS